MVRDNRYRVLVAGGQQNSVNALRRRLGEESHRYAVLHCPSPEMALEYIALWKPDAVLADAKLKVHGGHFPEVAATEAPVLIMTDVRPAYEHKDLLRGGAKGYIPLNFAERPVPGRADGETSRVIDAIDRMIEAYRPTRKERVVVKGSQLTPRMDSLQRERGYDIVLAGTREDFFRKLLSSYTSAAFFERPDDPDMDLQSIDFLVSTFPYLGILNLQQPRNDIISQGSRTWYPPANGLESCIPCATKAVKERLRGDREAGDGYVYVLSGPSASTKTTTSQAASAAIPLIKTPPRMKTRGPRPYEVHGVDSLFVTDEHLAMLDEIPGELLFNFQHKIGREGYDTVTGYRAALSRGAVDEELAKGNDVLVVLANPAHVKRVEMTYPNLEKIVMPSTIMNSYQVWRDRGAGWLNFLAAYREHIQFKELLDTKEWSPLDTDFGPDPVAARVNAFVQRHYHMREPPAAASFNIQGRYALL